MNALRAWFARRLCERRHDDGMIMGFPCLFDDVSRTADCGHPGCGPVPGSRVLPSPARVRIVAVAELESIAG